MKSNTLSRRDFTKKTCFGTLGFGLTMTSMSGCQSSQKWKLNEIGLQVSTIRQELENDWKGTLTKVAEIGYHTLELGGYYGTSLQEFKNFLNDINLIPIAGGASMAIFHDSTDEIIEASLAMGKKYLICYWPWIDSLENETIDDWKVMSESLNKIGLKAKKAGLEFTYHNHDLEFKVTEGKMPYDVILNNTDPRSDFRGSGSEM